MTSLLEQCAKAAGSAKRASITIRIQQNTYNEIESQARKLGRSMNQVLSDLLDMAVSDEALTREEAARICERVGRDDEASTEGARMCALTLRGKL